LISISKFQEAKKSGTGLGLAISKEFIEAQTELLELRIGDSVLFILNSK
jgi:nitrogen-specific signal transduction histidine kinase